jgi:predicted aconitase
VRPTTSAPFELFAKREINALSTKVGILRGELGIVRCTLNSLLTALGDCWEASEIIDLIARIDGVLEESKR